MKHEILFISDLDDLADKLSDIIIEKILPMLQGIEIKTNEPDLITRKEACKLLGISSPTLNDWTKSGKINGYKISSRVRYKKSELLESLKKIDLA